MPERAVTVKMPDGRDLPAVEVSIVESSERWSEFTLEDGSVVRCKASMLSFTRIADEYDQDGNPLYFGKGNVTSFVVSAPDSLKRKIQ